MRALGIDVAQWRALSRTYVAMEFRGSGGAMRPQDRSRRGGSPLSGLLFVSGIGGLAFAVVSASTASTMISASLLTTYGAANTMMVLLVDFTGVVLSPDDYSVLGHRPVSSRTYFAARLAAVALYVGAISLAIALLPALVYAYNLGALAFPATLAAVLLCNLATAILVINTYVVLLRWVHPTRLRRAMSYLQLGAASSFYLTYYLATRAFQGAVLQQLDFVSAPWLWSIPTTWFAALIGLVEHSSAATLVAASAALLVACGCVPLAAGRLSLDYARRLGELAAVAEPVGKRRAGGLPGFRHGEARAVALLVRAQFRFDQRFRMGVLGILPLTGFYLLLGLREGALQDPFLAGARPGGPGVFMAVVFIPMTLHAALTVSESWRAAWIFFATPISPARVILAAKNFVALYFLGPYVVILTAVWSYFFERVWHAFVHALIAGLLAHLMLQLHVILKPALPFAAEPRKAERAASMFWVILLGSAGAGVMPLVLPWIYRTGGGVVVLLGLLLAVTAVVEYAVRLRIEEALGELEFRN